MLFVVLGWVIFRADTISEACLYIRAMFGLNGNAFSDGMFSGYLLQNIILIAIGMLLCTPIFRIFKKKTESSTAAGFVSAGVLIVLFLLSVSSIVSNSYNPFIYFNF